MTKNVDNKRIAKYILMLADAAKEGASKTIDFVRLHQKETFIINGILVIGGTIAGTVRHVAYRKQQKIGKQFELALQRPKWNFEH